jgi:hypothetical protein
VRCVVLLSLRIVKQTTTLALAMTHNLFVCVFGWLVVACLFVLFMYVRMCECLFACLFVCFEISKVFALRKFNNKRNFIHCTAGLTVKEVSRTSTTRGLSPSHQSSPPACHCRRRLW